MKISVVAHTNTKKPRIEKDLLGRLHIYVGEPPLEGRANKAIAEALAEYFNTQRRNVILLLGEKYKNKLFEIDVNNRRIADYQTRYLGK